MFEFILQALSISRSLLNAKSAAEGGQVKCRELKDLAVLKITEAGGKIDYVEVGYRHLSSLTFLYSLGILRN